jgi:hypothetical protein
MEGVLNKTKFDQILKIMNNTPNMLYSTRTPLETSVFLKKSDGILQIKKPGAHMFQVNECEYDA